MKKVKSLVKKLIGRGKSAPYAIDAVQRTATGFCIIGWYYAEQVSNLEIVDRDNFKPDKTIIKISRDDVFAATGKRAVGFELHVHTTNSIEQHNLLITTTKGTVKAKLPVTQTDLMTLGQSSKVESATSNKSGVKAACEILIDTPSHAFLIGWVLDDRKGRDFVVKNGNGDIVATLEDGLRLQRKDLIDAYGDSQSARTSGLNYFFRKTKSDLPLSDLQLTFVFNDKDVSVPIDNVYQATEEASTNAMRLLNAWQPNASSHLKKANLYASVLQSIFPADISASVTRHDFNEQPENPKASLIIPLYGRYDFMRYQLSHFGHNDQTANCEVIYVVDDPKIIGPVMKLAREMQLISTQPFSVLTLSRNLGFGKANNIGVAHAKAEYVALVNSDILPKSKDWLEKLLNTAQRPDAGIVGARLLFEDESLQHDGMAPMRLAEYPGILFNDHPRKGWPKELSPYADSVSPCPLITAACWVMKKSLFEDLKGFSPEYVLGDFEDSDMCLRMIELGKTNFIRRDVELYHLERQSQNLVQPGRWKHNITILNAIHFNNKWKTTMESMEKVDA